MTTGSNSKFPLTRLAAKMNEVQKDGAILSNRQAIEVLGYRMKQLAERIDLNEAPERMENLTKLWGEYTRALDANNRIEADAIRKDIDIEFEKAYHDYAAWKQMFEAVDLNSKLLEREMKLLQGIRAIMTAEDAYDLAAKLLAAVLRVEEDPKKLRQIQYEFTRLIGELGDDVAERLSKDDLDGSREEAIVV